MRFDRGEIVYINVKKGEHPRHGWNEGVENNELGVVYQGYSDHTVLYNWKLVRHAQYNAELVKIAHPFQAVVTSLGHGYIHAIFDAPNKEDALKLAEKFVAGEIADSSGRKVKDYTWLENKSLELKPILIGVEDKKPLMDTTLGLLLKRNGL